ncbi:hypothetical protein RUM44_005596 [Polyplax serrata]|uniref:Uncharacterized protein n=1 Tax=Polyplax serrata TaxID=468196 RepID=A0ABR1ADV6_POLSC
MEEDTRRTFNSQSRNVYSSDVSISELDDPISAYFKKRCENSTAAYFKRYEESDRDSSLGLIDVENVSLFDDVAEDESSGVNANKIRASFPVLETFTRDRHSHTAGSLDEQASQEVEHDLNIKKQRVLAQKTLMKVNNKLDGSLNRDLQASIVDYKDSHILRDFSNKIPNNYESEEPEKNWFQPNLSPNTPRYFNDELSSFGGEENMPSKTAIQYSPPSELQTRQNDYMKKINTLFKEMSQLSLGSDFQFKTQSQDELISKLEDDEKQFKLENSGLLHNSKISNFSALSEEQSNKWTSENIKQHLENKKLSIGQFFNMRSNRVSSLVGSPSSITSETSSFLSPVARDAEQISSMHEQSQPILNTSKVDGPKPRRCVSTLDLKQTTDASLSRHVNPTSSRNSTVMIQNILAEMESGLSGTQVYEKLIKTFGMQKVPGDDRSPVLQTVELINNRETPKSYKTSKRNGNANVKQENLDKIETSNFRQIFDQHKSEKNNEPYNGGLDVDTNKSISVVRDERVKSLKGKKGFDSSTPKLQDKFKTTHKQIPSEKEIWELPKISFIHPAIDLNKTGAHGEADKTLTANPGSTEDLEFNRNTSTIILNDSRNIEDTITAGDLTILSQRIEEMKEDGICTLRSTEPEEPVLLTVVQKLADLPKGSVDCSSLIPVIRDQFPELLTTFPTPSSNRTSNRIRYAASHVKDQNEITSITGDPVIFPTRIGFGEKMYTFAEVRKNIFVPLSNTSKNWFLVSVDSLIIIHPKGDKLYGVKKNDEWNVCDFVSLKMKETIVPPEGRKSLMISFMSKIPIKLDLKINFAMKQLLGKEIQIRTLQVRTYNINPLNSITVVPKDSINFGVLAEQCTDQRTFHLNFDGSCELPLILYVEEEDSSHFYIKPLIPFNGGEWRDKKFYLSLREGEKQVIEFLVFFQPNTQLNYANEIQEFKGSLVIQIDSDTDSDGVLQRIPLKGSVGFAKFYWNSRCSPLVFQVSEKSQSLTRSFPLKNVGSIPLTFSIKIEKKDSYEDAKDDVFVAPKSLFLKCNEESAIGITFNAKTEESCVKRVLSLQLNPNGRAKYDVELIGITSPAEGRSLSRTSNASSLTKSMSTTESVPVKLVATTHSLSWASVPLEKEVRQTFQLKNVSNFAAIVRISFKHEGSGTFRLVNENGERVQKIRKMLKPDCPFNLTVAFRPDFLGPHYNALFIETNRLTRKKMILLNGIGGMPNLFIGNLKSDLNGTKMIVLQGSSSGCQLLSNTLEFKNGGRIHGFVLIKSNSKAITLCSELTVSPTSFILPPDSRVTVTLAQRLKNDDLRQLLSDKDISKVTTLSIIMGDEPSRLRLRKLIQHGHVIASQRSEILTAPYVGEQELNINSFVDSPSFENQFLKSLKVIEVAVVVEKSSGVHESTVLIDEDETTDEFVTICSVADSTINSSAYSH